MEGDPYRISCWPSQPDVATKRLATWASKKPHAWQEALKERLQKLKKLKRNKGFIWKNYSLSSFSNLSFFHNWSSSPATSVGEVRHPTTLSPSSPAVVYLKTPTPQHKLPLFFRPLSETKLRFFKIPTQREIGPTQKHKSPNSKE